MPDTIVSWRTEALRMLYRRDRYSQETILHEFSEKMKLESPFENVPNMSTASIDDFHITKLMGGPNLDILIAFIVWEFDTERNHATVLAVTKKQPWNKRDVSRLSHQSHRGYLAPRWPWQGCEECDAMKLQNT